jgi:hypothetical protein
MTRALVAAAVFSAASAAGVVIPGAPAPQRSAVPDAGLFFAATSVDDAKSAAALAELGKVWHNRYTSMLIDVVRLLRAPRPTGADAFAIDLVRPQGAAGEGGQPARARILAFLEQQTGQRFGGDLGAWREWMWSLPYEPHPQHMAFKAAVYRGIDPRMAEFFTGQSLIRLDEIDWGGVAVNGIPPLARPTVVAGTRADWLEDSNYVFGVVVNGEARAYPKRILAWHEMAHDTVGGVPLTIVYCTLCGTVIPYHSVVGGERRTFGTSGLLYRSNKLMFDEETKSLWSTLEGRPVVGPLAGQPLTLEFEPVVTTTWGEWRRAHPETSVISIDTGFERDYAEGAAYRDYFATDRLMFRVPRTDNRLQNKDEVLGLLLPARGGGREAVAFAAAFLTANPLHQAEHAGRRLVIVTSTGGANRVYDAGDVRFTRRDGDDRLIDSTGLRWTVTEPALVPPAGSPAEPLPRIPAFRAFWFGWYAQFPETALTGGGR